MLYCLIRAHSAVPVSFWKLELWKVPYARINQEVPLNRHQTMPVSTRNCRWISIKQDGPETGGSALRSFWCRRRIWAPQQSWRAASPLPLRNQAAAAAAAAARRWFDFSSVGHSKPCQIPLLASPPPRARPRRGRRTTCRILQKSWSQP